MGAAAVANNFDWFVGTWTSKQRRLREVLAGCDEWYYFAGTHTSWNVLEGAGNVDEAVFPTQGFSGVTLRLYDKSRDEWSLYWASSRTGILSLPPVVGRFGDDGRGYVWCDITATTARREQAFSVDGGATWEDTWIAEFSRSS